jgi:hypothetical protein
VNTKRLLAPLLCALTLAACSSNSKVQAGSRPALLLGQVNSVGANVHVGQEFTYAAALLQSTSDEPVTIKRVTFTQPQGLGTVITPGDIEVSVVGADDQWPSRVWSSYPPTSEIGSRCRVQQVEPAAGLVLPPDGAARVVVKFTAKAPGDFFLGGQQVAYTVGGKPGSIILPNRFVGTVTKTGGSLHPDSGEEACANLGHVLPG